MQFTLLALASLAVSLVSAQEYVPKLVYPKKRAANQDSLTLDSSLVQEGSFQDGQTIPVAGQSASLTSQNNFINFCGQFPDVPLTNGQQIFQGSCNGIPHGRIPAKDKMFAQIIQFPTDGAVIDEGVDINFQIGSKNLKTGTFTNAQLTYYSAPTQLDDTGVVIGHTHVTVQAISAIDSTDVQDTQTFAFFKGIDDPDVNGISSALAAGGLKAGFYRFCTLGSNANHASPLMPVAQRASGDDCVRFTVKAAAGGAGGNAASAAASSASATASSAAATASATTAATGKGANKGGNAAGNAKGNAKGQAKGGKNGKRTNFTRPNFARRNSTSGRARMARDE